MGKYNVGDEVMIVAGNRGCHPGYIDTKQTINYVSIAGNTYYLKDISSSVGLWSENELELIRPNNKCKETTKMNIVTYAKLNKDQRVLYKVGVIDNGGNLTQDGREILLDMLASDKEIQAKLVVLAKDFKKEQKED